MCRREGGTCQLQMPISSFVLFCFLFFASVSSCKICVEKVEEKVQENEEVKEVVEKEGEEEDK